jgi:hypothetical protein
MKRGKTQALYKYLPESWIDFSVRGKERKQYIAKVTRWNSEKLVGINTKRLIRIVNNAIQSFAQQGANGNPALPAITGFGSELTSLNCDVLSPKASEEERGIIANISPLTFYCKKCYKVFQFNSEDTYYKYHKCNRCGVELTQLRQIYFCKCGYATDKHSAHCAIHGNKSIKWDGEYNFICTECNKKIPMQVTCPVCGNRLGPKVALDPSQFFTFSLSLIDLIDEKLEEFISDTEYGQYIVLAYWLNMISEDEMNRIIKNGITTDDEEYQKIYQQCFNLFLGAFRDETQASIAAKASADQQCGNQYHEMITSIKTSLCTSEENVSRLAEMILEYNMVKNLDEVATLDKAIEVAKVLNTNANPEGFWNIANKFGITSAQVCDDIPFVSCSYGYTRGESEYKDGVQLHAFKEETNGRKNIYAIKMNTEGVLFEFDRKKIIEWLLKNEFIDKKNAPDTISEKDIKMWFINHIKPELIHPFTNINEDGSPETYYVYRLLHSISHILIRAAADIGGLGKDSLSEYIFPGVPAVLIYCQNSQGFNLGSLFNTFEAYFDKWLLRANSAAQKCVFDPICIERYKACTGCLYLNEVSCEHFNKDLDRSLIIGHLNKETRKRIVGFWEEI